MLNINKKNRRFSEIEISDVVVLNGDHEKRKLEAPIGMKNLNYFFIIIVLAIIFIVFRAFQLQIVKGAYYTSKAENNRVSTMTLKAPRGIITDKNGKDLVKNIASNDAVIIPSMLPRDKEEVGAILERCLAIIKFEDPQNTVNIPKIEEIYIDSSKPYLVKQNISQQELVSIQLNNDVCPGFMTEETAVREYINPESYSHVLGYVGKVNQEDLENDSSYLMTDIVGKSGIESYWEEELRGIHGFKNVEVDSSGIINKNLKEKMPVSGNQLVLGIEDELQQSLYNTMKEVIEERGVKNGAAVVIDPSNGAIRAYVSFPGYDNNIFQRKTDSDKFDELINNPANPLLDRVIGGTYHPGSTIKPIIATAALQEGIVDADDSFDTHGYLEIDNMYGTWRFNDWKNHGPDIDVYKGIAYSCDVYFYYIGGGFENFRGLGINKIKHYSELYGLGSPTGIDLGGERSGFIPTPEWKEEAKSEKWYIGNTYHASIGQGDVSITPLQVANQIVPIANGGSLYKPRLVTEIKDQKTGEIIQRIEPEVVRSNFIDRQHIDAAKQGMVDAVDYGTLKTLQILEIDVAGKTGTAQIGGTKETHSWFVGFTPIDNPKYVIAILVEKGGESTDAAVPVAKYFLADIYDVEQEESIEDAVKTIEETGNPNAEKEGIDREGNRVLDDEDEKEEEENNLKNEENQDQNNQAETNNQ